MCSKLLIENVSERWVPELRHHCPNAGFVLVGLKKDLRDNQEVLRNLRKKGKQPISYAQVNKQPMQCNVITI